MESLARELTQLGLSEKEALVYVAALQLGPAPVHDIAAKSEVNRATTYLMMELLEKRGLMMGAEKDGRRVYLAAVPDRLMSLLHLQKKELEQQEEEMAKLLPKLHAIYNHSGEKPEVRYLEGPGGVEAVRRNAENLQGEIVQIIGYDAFSKAIDLDSTADHRRMLKDKQTKVRALLVTDREVAHLRKHFEDTMNGILDFQIIHASSLPFKVEGEITVQSDRVFLFTYASEPLAVEIRSAVMADMFRSIFELAWHK